MIKSKFQLEKEKERSILDCITSITGKLNEATVVGFSAPMGGIAGAQPSWAQQQVNKLTNPVLPLPLKPGQSTPFIARPPFVPQTLPLPLKPGQSTPFIARPPFVGQAQSSQQPQGSNQAQIATPSPDIVEPSPDELYRQRMNDGNFSGSSISDEATMRERATERMGQAPSTTSMPSYLPQTQNTPTAEQRVRAAGEAQAVDSAKEIALTPEQREARRVAREAAEDKREGYTDSEGNHVDGEKDRIHKRGQAQRDARNAREADRLRGEGVAQDNREKERDQNRRRYSRGSPTNQNSSPSISSGGSNVKYGLGGGQSIGGGGKHIPESFKGSLNRLDEIASGISGAMDAIDLGKHIKDFAVNAAGEAIDFTKIYAPKIGYIALTPPKVLAAAATGRLAGLGYSKEGSVDTFNYYRNMIAGLGKAGGNLLTGLAATAAGQKLGTAAGKVGTAVGKVIDKIPGGRIGMQVGKDVVGALDPEGHINAFADEAATLAGAAMYDPRMAGLNFKTD
jgi:hypothetical protein